ncbi:MAG: AAA family ATPase [Proteobacteria bacterium]|nr:AAA family ATPase [Pseudomonadota bacterium]
MSTSHLHQLWSDFLEAWPLKRVRQMSLEEYTNLTEDSFVHAIEFELAELGAIGGVLGMTKFGIYRYPPEKAKEKDSGKMYDDNGEYGWLEKYGLSRDDAFATVRSRVVEVIEASERGDMAQIENIELAPQYKWKLAFLYQDQESSNQSVLPLFVEEVLFDQYFSINPNARGKKTPHYVVHKALQEQHKDRGDVIHIAQFLLERHEPKRNRNQVKTDRAPQSVSPSSSPSSPPSPLTNPRNIILYGPPGTGKTYQVRRRALELLGDASAVDAPDDYVQAEWERMRQAGQVVFCTFHQAFAYEEFVEGLRAHTEDGEVRYSVEPGIFKRLALNAAVEGLQTENEFDRLWQALIDELDTKPRVMKSASEKRYRLERSGENIAAIPAEDVESRKLKTPLNATRAQMFEHWNERATLGEYPTTTALGGNGDPNATARWIVYRELLAMENTPMQKTGSTGNSDPVVQTQRAFAEGCSFHFAGSARHFVLIIDEINRANIARVFGELITLLEPDKRLGSPNELRVQLPSSKEWFGVPPNLHVLGTMNTADRSIALMDVALRRRFTFEEMMPDADVLRKVLKKEGTDKAVRDLVVAVFTKLNERLRFLYDREHQIGHAYFLGVRTRGDLRQVFADRILPLLQEYFFGQWDKVALALGYPLNAEGAPREFRDKDTPRGTLLTVSRLAEKDVLGFDHDEYIDQIAWDVHPVFRPRGPAPTSDKWLDEAFAEVVGNANRSAEAAPPVASPSDAKEP